MPAFEFTESIFESEVSGFEIYERIGKPDPERNGVVLVLHGLGDYSRRHDEVADILLGKGYTARLFDWPGNGNSSGKRGHLPNVQEAAALICEALKRSDEPVEGIYAHSTGAYYLLHAIFLKSDEFVNLKWVWLSSPLISPRNGQSDLKIRAARFLVRYLPGLTLSTGVHQSDCFHSEKKVWLPIPDDPKLHHRISLRVAVDLIVNEGLLGERLKKLPGTISWFFTQGDEDRVCPLPIAMGAFNDLASSDKTFVTISGARHEPMHEPDHSGLVSTIRAWLNHRISE